jgi:RimJ/RimL family protein N-acetyltransferase
MLLTIQQTTMDDLNHIMTWVNDPDVVANIANIEEVTLDQERVWLANKLQSPNDRLYSVFDGDTYVGQGGVHQIYWPARNGRISVILKKEFQNRGYGQMVIRGLLRLAFDHLKLHKVFCVVWEDNPKTVHLYRDKMGMKEEGRLIDEYFLDGRHHNMIRLYMLEGMFKEKFGR